MKTKIGLGKVLNFTVVALAFTSTQAGSAVETLVTYDVVDITGIDSNLEPKIGVTGVSADGSVVLGWYRTGRTEETWAQNHFIWKDGELTYLSDLVGQDVTSLDPIGLSADGSAIFAVMTTQSGTEAVRLDGGIVTSLGLLPEGVNTMAVSADGSVIVGYRKSDRGLEACRWENGSMTALGDWPIGEYSSWASGVSADGSVVVLERWSTPAFMGAEVFRWENGVMSGLGDSTKAAGPFALGISGDGSVVVGSFGFRPGFSRAFRWEDGISIELESPDSEPSGLSHALSASFDGSVVAGFADYATENGRAVFWSEANGWQPVPLNDLLEEAGIDRDGYWLGRPTISADGSAIVGSSIKSAWNNLAVEKDSYQIYRIRIVKSVEIIQPPQSLAAAPGSTASFIVLAGGPGGESFEWKHGDTVIGGNSPTLTLTNVQATQSGLYTVTVTANGQSVSSRPVTLGIKAPPYDTGRLLNISTRGQVLKGSQVLIAGFVVEGYGEKNMLIRGIGPGLGQWVEGACTDPMLELFCVGDQGSHPVATNKNWGTDTDGIPGICRKVGAFALEDGSRDAAIHLPLAPGAYTARVTDLDGAGLGLVELYDADAESVESTCRVVNISARGEVGTASRILIAGFVVSGDVPNQILIRGVGPGLGGFGVEGSLADPVLKLCKDYEPEPLWVASNNNWSDNANAVDIVAAGTAAGAFDLVSGSKDAAILTWLEPGSYTAQVSGIGITTGVALVEVYEVQ